MTRRSSTWPKQLQRQTINPWRKHGAVKTIHNRGGWLFEGPNAQMTQIQVCIALKNMIQSF